MAYHHTAHFHMEKMEKRRTVSDDTAKHQMANRTVTHTANRKTDRREMNRGLR
jgi:hypothetical protein